MSTSVELAPAFTIDEYYELRLYEMLPGRMHGMHALLGVQAPPIFERAGIPRPLAFWESHSGPTTPLLAYLIRWKNLDERMLAWKAFYADPEWTAARKVSYADGQRVERTHVSILRPSPAWQKFKTASSEPVGGLHELRFYDLVNNDPNAAHTALAEVDLPVLTRHGATVLGVFATWFGTSMNQAVTILAWPDAATMQKANAAYLVDPVIQSARDAERRTHGRPLVRNSSIQLMLPLSYGQARANLAPAPN